MWNEKSVIAKPQTLLIIAVPSLDKDFGHETLCSKIELNSSSSSSPSNGGCKKGSNYKVKISITPKTFLQTPEFDWILQWFINDNGRRMIKKED